MKISEILREVIYCELKKIHLEMKNIELHLGKRFGIYNLMDIFLSRGVSIVPA